MTSWPHHGVYGIVLFLIGTALIYFPVVPFSDVVSIWLLAGGGALIYSEWHEHSYHHEEHHSSDIDQLDAFIDALWRVISRR